MAASAEDLAKVLSAFTLVRGGDDVDLAGNQVANAYGVQRLAAFVKSAPLSAFPASVSPLLATLLVDLAEAQIWGTTDAAANTARTNALLPRDGSGNCLASGLAVRIWDSWEGIEKEEQRARAAVAYMLNSLMPDAISAWTAVYPSGTLATLRTQFQAITGAQLPFNILNPSVQSSLRAACSFSTVAARAAEGEMAAIPTFAALMASVSRPLPAIAALASATRDEIRATRPAGGLPVQGNPAIQAARLAARNRLLTGIGALLDL